jgi:hypothetical protein
MKTILIFLSVLQIMISGHNFRHDGTAVMIQDHKGSSIHISDKHGKLSLLLDCNNRCTISEIKVTGHQVATHGSGAFSSVMINGKLFTTLSDIDSPTVTHSGEIVTVDNIVFGKEEGQITEQWTFRPDSDFVDWTISRDYQGNMTLDDTGFPGWSFEGMNTWDGAMLGTGGVAWSKFFDKVNASLGSHTGKVVFWNREKDMALGIEPVKTTGSQVAIRFSRQPDNSFTLNYTVSEDELRTKNFLARFIIDRQDIWDSFDSRGRMTITYRLKASGYNEIGSRGKIAGINTASVENVLNTIARVGVVDEKLMGSNNWHLDMGFVCLHEHWVAQMGLAIDDPCYTENYRKTLDYFRDHAIKPDGDVMDRWAYRIWDSEPGTFRNGFYECQWGDLYDSNTDYVINVAQLFHLNGDSAWVSGHLRACEKALGFLLARDSDHNGLVEVPEDSHTAQRGSDWIDVIWASWENAFLNAKLYYALTRWASIEEITGNHGKAAYYRDFASRCRKSFNKPVAEGGFWNPEKKWYVYWRDKDGSVHGDNLVTPVNFMAIAFGICTDQERKKAILGTIEEQMLKENLFMWPISFFPYKPDEGYKVNYPFPNYENGDIFLAWGEAGIRAYMDYDPAIPVKYIKNVLRQYEKDGLAFQRYKRIEQTGEGSDILANNCLPVVGLYRDILGIEPMYNRLLIEPHLTHELDGTSLRYNLRNQDYHINLSTGNYAVEINNFSVRSHAGFGISSKNNTLLCYYGSAEIPVLKLTRIGNTEVNIEFTGWGEKNSTLSWISKCRAQGAELKYEISTLKANTEYNVLMNGNKLCLCRSDSNGRISFSGPVNKTTGDIFMVSEIG